MFIGESVSKIMNFDAFLQYKENVAFMFCRARSVPDGERKCHIDETDHSEWATPVVCNLKNDKMIVNKTTK